ncbi:MAG: hypothetical protein ACW98Y_21810 [Candidatus Thorarchaeota archaeon]|jgi:hypothetical protein
MKNHPAKSIQQTKGILLGHEIGEWAGFKAGPLTIRTEDGQKMNLRYGRESRGIVPPVGSRVSIEYTLGVLPEVLELSLVEEKGIEIYSEEAESYASTLLWGRPKGSVAIAVTEVLAGIWIILIGLSLGAAKEMAPYIFGIFGAPHIIIGLALWEYAGK